MRTSEQRPGSRGRVVKQTSIRPTNRAWRRLEDLAAAQQVCKTVALRLALDQYARHLFEYARTLAPVAAGSHEAGRRCGG